MPGFDINDIVAAGTLDPIGAGIMKVLLSFAPLILFHVLVGFEPVELSLGAATGAALLVLIADLRSSRRSLKLLNAGTFALFAALMLYGLILRPDCNVFWVRLAINAGLLAIVLVTLAVGQPFTLQYAREQTPTALWNSPVLLAVNYRITAVWAAVFAVFVLADLARLFVPAVPHWTDTAVGIAGLVLALKFTSWYPAHIRAQRGTAPT